MKPLHTMPRWYLPLLLGIITPLLVCVVVSWLLFSQSLVMWRGIWDMPVTEAIETLTFTVIFYSGFVSIPAVLWIDYTLRKNPSFLGVK